MVSKTIVNLRRKPYYVWFLLILILVYGIWLLVVSPRGEFPLNDDWAYAQSVRHLLDTGELRISPVAAAAVVFQIYWGAIFAKLLGGFSFTALRCSTLVLSFISGPALYAILRQCDLSPWTAALGALALVANPAFVYLSYTFMSDIFFLGLMLLSLAFYVHGLRGRSGRSLLVGSLFASAAYLSRQLGVALPIAVIAALIVKERRLPWRAAWLAGLAPLITLVAYTVWQQVFHGATWAIQLYAVQNAKAIFRPVWVIVVMQRLLMNLLYLGIFCLPATVAQGFGLRSLPRSRLTRLGKIFGLWLVALGMLVGFQVILTRLPMPYIANVINTDGMGLLSLMGQKTSVTPIWVYWLVTIVAPFAGAAQGTLWTEALLSPRRESTSPGFTLLLASLLMAVPTAVVILLWDRYLLVFVPAGLYLTLRLYPVNRRGLLAGLCVCAVIWAYSLNELADYFAWNAARWEAGRALVAQGVPPASIGGGIEWTGWYDFETAWPKAMAQGKENDSWAWMSITPKTYWLAYEPLPGYTVVDRTPYRSWLSSVPRYVYTLRPNAP